MATTTHGPYRFSDGRQVTVTEAADGTLTYKLDGKKITDPDQLARLITDFRRG